MATSSSNSQTTIRFAEPISYLFRSYEGRLVTGKDPKNRQKIADRIKAMDVDVLAVQEVEDVGVLHEFALNDLSGMYPYQVLIEGNDPRLIDVGLLSKLPIGGVTSWKYATHGEAPHELVFGRDLLEVEILDPQRRRRLFTLYNNHLKSNYARWDMDPEVARRRNGQRRQRQAETVARIVEAQMRPDSSYVIVGDMNDIPDSQFLEPMIAARGLGLQNALLGAAETRPPKQEDSPASHAHQPRLDLPAPRGRRQHVHALRPDLGQPGAGRQADRRVDRPAYAARRRRQRPRPMLDSSEFVSIPVSAAPPPPPGAP